MKNIEININSNGSYEALYPFTLFTNLKDTLDISSSKLTGNFPANRISGTLPVNIMPVGSGFCEYGSYVGTGNYGDSNKNSIIFSITPNLLVVQSQDGTMNFPTIFVRSKSYTMSSTNNRGGELLSVTWGNNSINWYVSGGAWTYTSTSIGTTYSANGQLNKSGTIYKYVAIG